MIGLEKLGVGRNLCWASLDAKGTMGGVLLMWDTSKLERLEVEVGSFSISYQFRDYDEGFIWVFSDLYRPLK